MLQKLLEQSNPPTCSDTGWMWPRVHTYTRTACGCSFKCMLLKWWAQIVSPWIAYGGHVKNHKNDYKNLRQMHRKGADAATAWVKCKANISFGIIFTRKRRFLKSPPQYWHRLHGWSMLQHGWTLRHEARHKSPHSVWFHFYEMSGIGKSRESESRLVVA